MNRAPVQVEAADVLPGLADAAAVAAVMREVAAIIETCTADHGLTNASKFAGVFLAVAPEWADHRADVDPQTRAVNCMRDLACRLRAHSERVGMDIVVNAGLASGPVTLGFAGQSRISFDATGSAVSLALAMVTSRVDGPLSQTPTRNSRPLPTARRPPTYPHRLFPHLSPSLKLLPHLSLSRQVFHHGEGFVATEDFARAIHACKLRDFEYDVDVDRMKVTTLSHPAPVCSIIWFPFGRYPSPFSPDIAPTSPHRTPLKPPPPSPSTCCRSRTRQASACA